MRSGGWRRPIMHPRLERRRIAPIPTSVPPSAINSTSHAPDDHGLAARRLDAGATITPEGRRLKRSYEWLSSRRKLAFISHDVRVRAPP
jgi:hypothetical protein